MMKRNWTALGCALIGLSAVTGCSQSEPSDSDMQNAIEKHFEIQRQKIQIVALTKLNCKTTDTDPARHWLYSCQIKVTSNPMMKSPTWGLFQKDEAGDWALITLS